MTSSRAEVYDPYASPDFIRIVSVEVLRTPVLRATFSDGAVRDIDFSETIARSRWFRTLATPTTFEDVEIVHDGRALQWVTGADYCADALRILGDEQRVGVTKEKA